MKTLSIIQLAFTEPSLFAKKVLQRLKIFYEQSYIPFYELYIKRDTLKRSLKRWLADNGEQTLRLNYPLNASDIVFDLGGYVGDFAAEVHNRYKCKVYVFEPHPVYYEKCVARFSANPDIKVFNYGVSDQDGEFVLSNCEDQSSFLENKSSKGETILCKVRKFSTILNELKVKSIALMKINIEGSEYPLLEHIIASDLSPRIDNYQIQFHNFEPHAVKRRKKIIKSLQKTHECTWCYKFIWENWQKKHT